MTFCLLFNVDIASLYCVYFVVLSIDAMDVSGEQQLDVEHNVYKQRLNLTGAVIADSPEKESQLMSYEQNSFAYAHSDLDL